MTEVTPTKELGRDNRGESEVLYQMSLVKSLEAILKNEFLVF